MATDPPTAGFIAQLDPDNPIDSDFVEGGNNWLQFVQATLKINQFPQSEDGSSGGWDIACTVKASEVNSLAGISSSQTVQEQIDALTARLDGVESNALQIGSIVGWPVKETVPSKYLTTDTVKPGYGEWWLCDGTNIDGTTYTALFDLIGNTYGGTDAASMLLPDLQGRVIAGRSTSTSRLTGYKGQAPNDNAQGNTGGEQSHTPILDETVSHDHGGGSHGHAMNVGSSLDGNVDMPAATSFGRRDSANNQMGLNLFQTTNNNLVSGPTSTVIPNEGGGQAFQVTQPTLIMAMYIRVL